MKPSKKKRQPRHPDELNVEQRFKLIENTQGAINLFGAMLQSVREATERKRKEREANGEPGQNP